MPEENNSWATLTNSPEQVLKLMILQSMEAFIQSIAAQKEITESSGQVNLARPKRFLYELYLRLIPFFKGRDELKKKVLAGLRSQDINDVESAFWEVHIFLYEKGLTKWDTRGGYDRVSWEASNKNAKLG